MAYQTLSSSDVELYAFTLNGKLLDYKALRAAGVRVVKKIYYSEGTARAAMRYLPLSLRRQVKITVFVPFYDVENLTGQ